VSFAHMARQQKHEPLCDLQFWGALQRCNRGVSPSRATDARGRPMRPFSPHHEHPRRRLDLAARQSCDLSRPARTGTAPTRTRHISVAASSRRLDRWQGPSTRDRCPSPMRRGACVAHDIPDARPNTRVRRHGARSRRPTVVAFRSQSHLANRRLEAPSGAKRRYIFASLFA